MSEPKKEYVERVSWEQVKADMQHVESDDNNGFIYGLYWIDFEREGDIIEVEWYQTSEEREKVITEGKYIVVFDE